MRRVEYLYGQQVDSLRKRGGMGFTLGFEGGNELIYEDSDVELPEWIKGMQFISATFSTTKSELVFGKIDEDGKLAKQRRKLSLKNEAIGIRDASGAVSWPARGEETQEPLPDDPSSERAAEGPDEDAPEWE